MAKGNAFIGLVTGKLGDTVGYRIANSADKVTQGWRPYVATVNNPQTEAQSIQRLKMAPAVNFYRALGTILNNAWQGQKYGTQSRNYFMSEAMKQSTGIPFVVKGDKRFYPGEYQVAQGSLARQSVTAIADNLLTTSLISPGVTGTWGEFSQRLINRNFGVKNGDKLTFIFVGTSELGEYLPAYSYVILDTSNTTAASEILASSNLSFAGAADAALQVGVINAVTNIVAGAVILSRLDTSTGTQWLRSNSRMFVTEAYKDVWMSTAAYQAAITSYMKAENVSSDWYLNAGINNSMTWVGPGGNSGSNLHVVSVENIIVRWSESSTTYVGIATMSDGTKRAARSNGTPSYICTTQGREWSTLSLQATDNNLATIRTTDEGVTGWLVVTPSGTTTEEP